MLPSTIQSFILNTHNSIIVRIDYIISLADKSLGTKYYTEDSFFRHYWVSSESFNEFESASASFIFGLYGDNHPYYTSFKKALTNCKPDNVLAGKGILQSIKAEVTNGWLTGYKGLVSAEIFSDLLEMAEYLLSEQYKDPSAVMVGSILEEHLRQLCSKHGISISDSKNERQIPRKADSLNVDLAIQGIYNKLDQKSVTSWLDLRNKAAHGNYKEYTIQQVELMLQGVRDFIVRNHL